MSLPLWCIFLAACLHFVSKLPLGKAQGAATGGYDNSSPRSQQAQLSDWGARALAAHQNQIESFPLFAVGMLVAIISGVDAGTAGNLGIAYLVARVIFLYAYIKDLSTFRSMVWIAGFGCTLALLCSPAWSG
jgi:uncharacterized MAPEG superfamily protein